MILVPTDFFSSSSRLQLLLLSLICDLVSAVTAALSLFFPSIPAGLPHSPIQIMIMIMRNIQISNKLENNMGGDNPNREAISKGGAHFFFFFFLLFWFFVSFPLAKA